MNIEMIEKILKESQHLSKNSVLNMIEPFLGEKSFQDFLDAVEKKAEMQRTGKEMLPEVGDDAKKHVKISDSILEQVGFLNQPKKKVKKEVVRIPNIMDINSAPVEFLMDLKGIREKKAEVIIEYRKLDAFKKIEDLIKVPGIGPAIFKKIKDRIRIGR